MNFKGKLRITRFDNLIWVFPIAIFIAIFIIFLFFTALKILWTASTILFLFFMFLVVLFLLRTCKKYNKAKFLFSKYISFWLDRIFFLCLTFTPVISVYCLFSKSMNEVPKLFEVSWWHFSYIQLIFFFILIALTLYKTEEALHKKDPLKYGIQLLARFAPLIIGIISLIIGFLCFYELYKIDILAPGKKHDAIITYIFYYNFFLVLPVLCHIPALLIVSKVTNQEKDKKYLFDYLFNFYKILYIENSVAISFGIVILSISIVSNFLHISFNDTGNKIEMWQLCLAIVRVLTPLILTLTIFGEAVKNFEKLFESDFYRKLRNLISSMNKHTILLGYGYLGKDILGELKEREIVKDKEFLNIITTSLEKRKIYKNLLIIDKNPVVFNNSTSDPIYGSIGIIEPESEKLSIAYPDFREDEFESESTIKTLCESIKKKFSSINETDCESVNKTDYSIKWLNKCLEKPNFYKSVCKANNPTLLNSDDINVLVKETKNYRCENFSKLNSDQQYNIKILNRLILEKIFPQITPKISQREAPVLAVGIIGDIINKSIYEKAKIQEASLLISAIADYDATNKLVEFLPNKKSNSIITVQDMQQLKLLLPNKVETYNPGTIILLHTSYIEGISLGRVLLSAAGRWIESRASNNHNEKEPLPKIVITGGGKQIYYLTETYLLGLRQIMGYTLGYPPEKTETGEIDLKIRILSDEEFYKNKVTKETDENLGIETGKWMEIMKSPSTCFTNDVISWDVLFSEPDDVNNIKKILNNEEYKPDIIVISHKRADYVIKILDAWKSTIINSNESKLNPVILVGTKGKEKKVERLLSKYHEHLAKILNNNKVLNSFPTQKYDAMVRVYDDAREQIGSIAKALTTNNPVSLYFCVRNKHGTLAEICSKLANFKVPSTIDDYKNEKKPSFLNITIQKCPGSPCMNINHRFLIESDVILEEAHNNEESKSSENIICSGLVVPTKSEEYIYNLLKSKDPKDPKCYDNYCIYRELCKTQLEEVPPSKNVKEPSFAKLYLCSNGYDKPGSVAHVLNNLLFAKTEMQEKNRLDKIVDLTYTRSFYSFNPGIHKKEFYGNIVSIEDKNKERDGLITNPCISFVSIHPIVDRNNEWGNYMEKLLGFFNRYTNNTNNQASYSLSINDSYNIRIEHGKHHDSCPRTCILAKRCKSLGI